MWLTVWSGGDGLTSYRGPSTMQAVIALGEEHYQAQRVLHTPLTARQKQAVYELWLETGWSSARIAKELGVTEWQARRVIGPRKDAK